MKKIIAIFISLFLFFLFSLYFIKFSYFYLKNKGNLSNIIQVTPEFPRVDDKIHIRANGLKPNHTYEFILRSTTTENGSYWQSNATFTSDKNGVIDLNKMPSLEGTYVGTDPAGLFWSQEWHSSNKKPDINLNLANDLTLELKEGVSGNLIAKKSISRTDCFHDPRIEKEVLDTQDIAATIYRPSGTSKPLPTILVLGGSDGGKYDTISCYFAVHGYSAVALAYFKYQNLPPTLERIPLEYFITTLKKLKSAKGIDENNLGLFGLSKGGELALVLSSYLNFSKAVIAVSPSNVVWNGISNNGSNPNLSSWTWKGKDLPYLMFDLSKMDFAKGSPYSYLSGYESGLLQESVKPEALIPIEKAKSTFLFINGTNDLVWPSSLMVTQAVKRLTDMQYKYPFEHFSFQNAGHYLWIPYSPSPALVWDIALGGNANANAEMSKMGWEHIFDFLNKHLKPWHDSNQGNKEPDKQRLDFKIKN